MGCIFQIMLFSLYLSNHTKQVITTNQSSGFTDISTLYLLLLQLHLNFQTAKYCNITAGLGIEQKTIIHMMLILNITI